jgi:hypothetical protein
MSVAISVVPAPMPVMRLCECGCGRVAPLDTNTNARLGQIKGVTRARFILGHQNAARVGRPCEVAKFELTDEQVAEALDRFFAAGNSLTSLCGKIFDVALGG